MKNSVAVITDQAFQQRWLPILFRLMAITLGGLHTWAAATSYAVSEDGISYLDIGDAYMQGNWDMALNSVWSPMYSWILGLVMRLLNPPIRWEFPVVHLVNLVIYLVAGVCFEFFWRQMTQYHQAKMAGTTDDSHVALPDWAWLGLGYTLFLWSSLSLIKIWAVTPDMLMTAFVYLAAGLVVRLRHGHTSWRTFIMLGVVLALGYLAKAAMFPLAFVFLAVSLFSVGDVRRAAPRVLVVLLVFLLFSAPFITAISKAKGELTFGDAGKLTYVRYVNGVVYPHWQGEPLANGMPKHASRKMFSNPPVYEFGIPIGGTYPISYDPSYWYAGVVPRFDLGQQSKRLITSGLFYFDLFFHQQGVLMVGVLILYLMGSRRQFSLTDVIQRWGLIIPALAAFGMYALVYVEGRYIAVFIVLFWADLLGNVRLPDFRLPRRLASVLCVIMILFMLLNILAFNLEGFGDLSGSGNRNQQAKRQASPPGWPGEVAEELHRLGVEPGDKVAVIGGAFDSFWARLARVQIVAEVLKWDTDVFWSSDPSVQAEVLRAFASTGAKAIVAESVPSYASPTDWHRTGDSSYYIFVLNH